MQTNLQCELFVYPPLFKLEASICNPNWILLLDYIYYTIKIMRNFTRDIQPRLLAIQHTEYQNAHYCTSPFSLGFSSLFFFVIAPVFKKQLRFLTFTPTSGMVTCKCPLHLPPPEQHQQVTLWQSTSPTTPPHLPVDFLFCSFVL